MTTTRRIIGNTIVQLVGKAVSMALAMVTVGLMARYLGPEQFGWYTTTVTYLQLFGIFIDFGLTLITTQMMAEAGADEEKIVKNIFGLRLTSALLFFGLAAALVWLFPFPHLVKIATTFTTLSFFCISLNQVFVGILQRYMAMWWVSIAENFNRVVILGALAVVMMRDDGFLAVMFVIVIGGAAQTLALLTASRRFLRVGLGFEWMIWKTIIGRSWPIALSIMFNLIYLRGDIFVMSLVRTQKEVGLYGAGWRVVDVLNTVPFMVMGVILPLLTAAWSTRNRELFNKYLQQGFDLLMFIGLPVTLAGMILSKPIMRVLGGPEFMPGAGFLAVILLAVLGVYAGASFAHGIVAMNAQRRTIWIYGVNALLAVVGYILFIPRWGAWAAAIITAINELLVPLLVTLTLWRLTHFSISLKTFWKVCAASFVMVIFVWSLRDYPLWMPVVTGLMVYGICAMAFNIISLAQLKLLIGRKVAIASEAKQAP